MTKTIILSTVLLASGVSALAEVIETVQDIPIAWQDVSASSPLTINFIGNWILNDTSSHDAGEHHFSKEFTFVDLEHYRTSNCSVTRSTNIPIEFVILSDSKGWTFKGFTPDQNNILSKDERFQMNLTKVIQVVKDGVRKSEEVRIRLSCNTYKNEEVGRYLFVNSSRETNKFTYSPEIFAKHIKRFGIEVEFNKKQKVFSEKISEGKSNQGAG